MTTSTCSVEPLRLITDVICPDPIAVDLPTAFLVVVDDALARRILSLAKAVHQLEVQLIMTDLNTDSTAQVGDDLEGDEAELFEATDFAIAVTATGFSVECLLSELSSVPVSTENIDVLRLCEHFGIDWTTYGEPVMPRVVVFTEGGVIHDMQADQPVSVQIVDYDTDGADEDGIVEMDDGSDAYCTHWAFGPDDISPEAVDRAKQWIAKAMAVKEAAAAT